MLLNKLSTLLEKDIPRCISRALEEDINSGDITSKLIPEKLRSKAEIVTREFAILCGVSWVNEIFAQLDASVQLHWLAEDGDQIKPDQVFLKLEGSTKVLLTAERTILNFLQTLSGTATRAYQYAQIAKHSNIQILDTRKTIPGLRLFSKDRSLALSAWFSCLEPIKLVINKNQLILEASEDDKWLVTDLPEKDANILNTKFLENKKNSFGYQFISIQSTPYIEKFAGFWILRDIELIS